MVYSNYYGWAIIGCLAFDICFRNRGKALTFAVSVFGVLILLYAPIWAVFLKEISTGVQIGGGPSLLSKVLNSAYCLYSVFVSESVAPWFWFLSIPASLAILVSVAAAANLLPWRDRLFLVYFTALFGVMAAIGAIMTKRLLFISGWLFLSLSVALAAPGHRTMRRVLALSLGLAAAVGWAGTVVRNWYAAPHFIEPWAAVAEEAADTIAHGVVVSNSPPFWFYANNALARHGLLAGPFCPGWVEDPRVYRIGPGSTPKLPEHSTVLLVNGVNPWALKETASVESWLRSNCALVDSRQLLRDSGSSLKSRFFPGAAQRPFRIGLDRYTCGHTP
jgi:hypothetical protein